MSNPETVISLESYAAVMAGLGAGLDLWRALAHAGVPPAEWERASDHWQARIDESAASDLALLVDFDAALLAAKRRFEPTFEPIASDVRAWAHFRRHFVTAAEPIAFLSRHELPLATYASLEASWANRVLADEALAATLRSHMDGSLEECPTLTRTPSPLLAAAAEVAEVAAEAAAMPAGAPSEARPGDGWRPAPLSVGQAQAAAAGAPGGVPAGGVPPVAGAPGGVPAVVQPPAMVPAQVASPIVDPAPPPSMRQERALPASARMGATKAIAAVPFPDGLPFQKPAPQGQAPAEESPPPIPLERYAVMLADHTLFGMTEAQLCEKHRLTAAQRAQAFQYWQGRINADPALQGRVKAVVTRYQAARTKAGERAPASSATPSPAIAQALAPPAAVPRVDFGSTVDPRQVVMSPVLPFVAGSSPPSRPTGGPRASVDHGATVAPGAAARPGGKSADPLPFVSPAPPSAPASQRAPPAGAPAAAARVADGGAGGAGQLSLEQYASLTVDLALEPERAPETIRRYGLTPAQRTLVDVTWTARLAQNPAERSAFEAACGSYRAWRLRSTSRP